MFSFSMGNVSWLLAKPCLLPLLHPPGCHPVMESRTMDPDLAPLGLCARGDLKEGSGESGDVVCGWTAEARHKGNSQPFFP